MSYDALPYDKRCSSRLTMSLLLFSLSPLQASTTTSGTRYFKIVQGLLVFIKGANRKRGERKMELRGGGWLLSQYSPFNSRI